ncbi:MAG TPA: monovalent cation/H(+) antiporter subunit G [Pseudothauera hydrothermalis]|jgi:multicomponent Na+:H+ antiporter subunit G|uniref:monovalent cation/H(+) antiporter subunit G n=1 Tax=Pseudothauera hydrothermalis TaxID=2184083 RepID=UPI000C7972FA|nr:monovalent cation/H(+) antiporter subunit G [Pseudothauera hydrothermalis]AUL99612.1 cation:proton antiporter [Rhodocyclaceae bacterium]HNQ75941.1 monovalent cation/H(+) antiporter subunit G [Pseudothauera hydrothermalis]
MSASIAAWLAALLIVGGALLGLVGAIGVLRLPDCYSRMHSASKAGALGAALILAGVAAATSGEAALEAVFALAVVLATAPLAAHAVSRVAHRVGVLPRVGPLGDALAAEHGGAGDPCPGARQKSDDASCAADSAQPGGSGRPVGEA